MAQRGKNNRRAQTILQLNLPTLVINFSGGDLSGVSLLLLPIDAHHYAENVVGITCTLTSDGSLWTLHYVDDNNPVLTFTATAKYFAGEAPPSFENSNENNPWTTTGGTTGDDLTYLAYIFPDRRI